MTSSPLIERLGDSIMRLFPLSCFASSHSSVSRPKASIGAGSTLVAERAAKTTGPNLPPFLTPKRRRRDDDPFIVPDIRWVEVQSKVYDRENNWITIHYVWMNRVWGFFERCEVAHVNSRRYRQWLETYDLKKSHGIPPHIQFGGGIESIPGGDPTFHSRWVAYAQETFC